MNMPSVKHPTVFAISGVRIQLVTFQPLSADAAARVALYLWRTEPQVRKSKDKLLVVPWLGDEATAALLPAPPRPRG